MTDLPPGEWSLLLVGAWWPAPPNEPTAGKTYWSDHADVKKREAEHVQHHRTQFGSRNHGHTAEDMLERFRIGKERLLDAEEHCRAKSSASRDVADAVIELRGRLTGIASAGNKTIRDILAKNEPEAVKLPQVVDAIKTANDEASAAGLAANNAIIDATQRMFTKIGVDGGARDWLESNGANFDVPPRRPPLTADEMNATAAGVSIDGQAGNDDLPFPFGDGHSGADSVAPSVGGDTTVGPAAGQGKADDAAGVANSPGGLVGPAGGTGSRGESSTGVKNGPTGSSGPGAASAAQAGAPTAPGAATGGTEATPAISSATPGAATGGASTAQAGAPTVPGAATGGTPATPSGTPATPSGALSGGGGGFGSSGGGGSGGGLAGTSPLSSSMPGLGGGGSGAPAMPAGLPGGGPTQAFASGMPGGPGGPTPPLHGGMEGSGLSQSSAPQVPPSPSSTPMAGGLLGNLGHLAGSSQEVAPTAPTTGATPTPAPPSVTTGPAAAPSAPISAAPAAPSGPLPGYGADLRPAAGTAPGVPAATAGAPAAPTSPPPGGPTTPASSGTTVASSSDRSTPGRPSPGPAGQSGAAMAGGMAAGGTAGAGAGTAAKRLAEHQDLQRKVDAVARQAPNLAWAAGLRDDETTTVVVTDLASGWIPPAVKLPPGVTLLDPAHRRRGTSAVDLLGAVIAAATHEPNTYVTEADPHDPVPGTGERARYGQHVDELGPTLIDVAGSSTRLPRIVQTVAQAMARRSGVADNEVELFRQVVADTAARVLSAYPEHAPRDVADWMLLAAVDALIDGSEELARYHLAWHQAVAVPHGGVTP